MISLWGIDRLEVDPNLQVFRSTDHTAHAAERSLFAQFGVGLESTHVVVSGTDRAEAFARANELDELLERSTDGAVTIRSPADFLVSTERAGRRLEQIALLDLEGAADDLERAFTAEGLNPRFFDRGLSALRDLARGELPAQPQDEELPEWLGDTIAQTGDGVSVALRVQAPSDLWPTGPPQELLSEIEQLMPEAQVASISRVGGELRELAARDLRLLGALAAAVVLIVVLLSFRGNPRLSLLAVIPVALGSIWSIGLWSTFGRPLDLVTLAVLPIILGVGIDDGLHVLHAWRCAPQNGMLGALQESGRALVLTTLTTAIAFASLLSTSVPGLQNAGALVSLGVFCCLAATLLALPALEPLLERRIATEDAQEGET